MYLLLESSIYNKTYFMHRKNIKFRKISLILPTSENEGNFLENDFWTPPPHINFVHDHILIFQQISIHI